MEKILTIIIVLASLSGLKACGDARSGHALPADEPVSQMMTEEGSKSVAPDLSEARKPAKTPHGGEASEISDDESKLEIPAPLTDRPEQILHRMAYTVSWNKDLRLPNWVAWQLTRRETKGAYSRKGVSFQADEEAEGPTVNTFDYARSGYDRGHMCPSGDNKWSEQAQRECFLMTNMCPQTHTLNAGDWNSLEMKCRDWARHYGSIYIVCGPVPVSGTPRRIGQHKVVVPERFFKVVLCMKGEPKAIGFIYNNDDVHHKMSAHAMTVDEVEEATGIDFFASLPDDVEQHVEARKNFNAW